MCRSQAIAEAGNVDCRETFWGHSCGYQNYLCLQGQEVDAMRRSQAMAEAGDVDGSMVCAQQAETYKKQHDTLQTQLTAPERVMTVCEVCGVFINSTDNDQRRQVRKMTEVSAAERHLQSTAAPAHIFHHRSLSL